MRNRHFAPLLAVLALLAAGCAGSNVVPLTYPAQLSDTPWCRWDVTLTPFADERPARELGVRDENATYVAASDVAEWVGRSLSAELSSRGCRCGWANAAQNAGGGFAVGGTITRVQLDKIGINQWTTALSIRVELSRGGELLFGQTYNGTVERTFVLPNEGPQQILSEALSEILGDAAVKLTEAMKQAS
jgi:hypothetical protein